MFVDVILPLAIAKSYTYRVPEQLQGDICIGQRVSVQFGKNKIYAAIIKNVHDKAPGIYEAKYVLNILDEGSIIGDQTLAFWEWISNYYLCTEGEVMNAALPSALKLTSESKIIYIGPEHVNKDLLNDKEYLILEALEINPELSLESISKILDQDKIMPLIKQMAQKGYIAIVEELWEKYSEKTINIIELSNQIKQVGQLEKTFKELESKPKQLELLQFLLIESKKNSELTRKQIQEKGYSLSTVKTLVDKQILSEKAKVVSRLKIDDEDLWESFELSKAQQESFKQVKESFNGGKPALLNGVTASGKTLIYIRLIEECIEQGKQALFLVPEIGLTTQLINRLKKYFGNSIGVYHSKFSDNERVEIWNQIKDGKLKVVLGARSALFLPFQELGLIVIDEEHDSSYKQNDPAPRYNARDAALFLSHLHSSNIILGSATPSLESYHNGLLGKYHLVELNERFGGVELPIIEIIDSKIFLKDKKNKSVFLSAPIQSAIQRSIENKEQLIIFQNRRGFAPFQICTTCAYIPKCSNCDVSLTYHKHSGQLHCHYCGYHQYNLDACPACGNQTMELNGLGTQKIEDELQITFPNIRVGRMDLDSTRKKDSFFKILSDLENGEIDVLVGTQMVTKGLDFQNVREVIIPDADGILNYPDFRANERSYQLFTQVSGRAGRRKDRGKVLIQTSDPGNPVFAFLLSGSYHNFYEKEKEFREKFQYPPFFRLINIDIKHREKDIVSKASEELAKALRSKLYQRVLGPEFPIINRIRNLYIKSILIKIERDGIDLGKLKSFLMEEMHKLKNQKEFKSAYIRIDVDPS